ncbi:pilus assembly PilX family protein [Gilvimarinus sp. 1_MG-2023]|uniref:pilus assembly PilX family protein n=1 Tax=Gilvimarinus sp. 1_MG-2023 TaxID=3062638 RepID=UPI0026E334B7|nr:PilX N-terminal domain-containing pilus assembly protein [Gilvimarinus sp. 1_MG-2023]MDO6748277.1 PilX N-terminal domain-containing pilus assembly protein [Gilvimarinus sp. 1_MG-2023]
MRKNGLFQQQGATLIVGLIMVLAITIVGLSAVRGTALQEQMAGNMRDRQIAFQSSESALRQAESQLTGGVAAAPIGQQQGFIESLESSSSAFWQGYEDNWQAQAATYPVDIPGVSQRPVFIVEEVSYYGSGLDGNANDFASLMKAGMDVRYRVTSRAVGGSTDAQVIVQSTYRNEI